MNQITIRQNRYVLKWRNTETFAELPLAQIRKIWKIMFSEPWRNGNAIAAISKWLPVARQEADTALQYAEYLLGEAVAHHKTNVRSYQRAVKDAKTSSVKLTKFQEIFDQMAAKAGI